MILTPNRAAWLRTVHSLVLELGRPPTPMDLATARGTKPTAQRFQIRDAIASGQLVPAARGTAFESSAVRVAPRALVHLGLPMVVYLAWPLSAAPGDGRVQRPPGQIAVFAERDAMAGREIARWLAGGGIAPVSPYLAGAWSCDWAALDGAAVALSQRADAVVAMYDPMVLGRPDVAAPHRLGIPVALVADPRALTRPPAASLWDPPTLVPPISTGQRTER